VTNNLRKDIKKIRNKDCEAALSKMKQLYDQWCFNPINVKKATRSEHQQTIESLLFLVDKRDGRIKVKYSAKIMLHGQGDV